MPMLMLGVLIGVMAVVGALYGISIRQPTAHEIQMSYADLAAVMLSAVSVIVTVIGVFIGVLAIWGYAQFKNSTRSAAIEHVKEELKDGGKLRVLLRERVDEILLSDAGVRSESATGRKSNESADEEFKD